MNIIKKIIGCILAIAIVTNVFLTRVSAETNVESNNIIFENVENDFEDLSSILESNLVAKAGGTRFYYKRTPQRAWGTTVDTLGKVVDVSTNSISKFSDRDLGVTLQPRYDLAGYGCQTSGALVKETQKLLTLNGYSVDQDGYWGPKTCSAVKSFQKARDLSADGVVGYNTWTALFGN